MKQWLLSLAAVTVACGTAVPVLADTSANPANDHAYIYSDIGTQTAGGTCTLQINYVGQSTNPTIQITTSLGSLNGQGSSITLTPTNGSISNLKLTSTKTGPALISVYEGGVLIGYSQFEFIAGPLSSIKVQASSSTPTFGGSTMITVTAQDAYGNPVPDNSPGSIFSFTTNHGQLFPGTGTLEQFTDNNVTLWTHNGVATAILTDSNIETDNVIVADGQGAQFGVNFNGNIGGAMVNVPITFSPPQSVNVSPVHDFKDTANRPAVELEAERELHEVGVVNGDTNNDYHPLDTMKRSEFAAVVANYMGLNSVASNLEGTPNRFADVASDSWYDGVVAADASLGYIHGDGTNFYPDKTISYAEVAAILLNNLGMSVTGTWPDDVIASAQTNGLFNGLGSFNANDPATRGDVAILVRNALHLVPQPGVLNTNGKTLESEMTGYTWNGDTQKTIVTAIPGNGTNIGNEVQVSSNNQTTTLHLANSIQLANAMTLNDLMNKNIKYLTNAVGLVTYIEVTP